MGITNPLNIATLVAIQAVGFAAAEGARAQEPDAEKRKYPGGAFNPAGMAADETSKLKELKNGERMKKGRWLDFFCSIDSPKNKHALTLPSPSPSLSLSPGRLAMVACAGLLGQHAANGLSPLEALAKHVADPWGANVATNGVSIPGF